MIYIVTVYKSNNFGSYLQAYALYNILKRYNPEVKFLDDGQRNFFEHDYIRRIARMVIKKGNIKQALFTVRKSLQNVCAWRRLPNSSLHSIRNCHNSVFVIGSDEIWNVSRTNCRFPFFWGEGLEGTLISYAPSINNCTLTDVTAYPPCKNLQRFKAISVRDKYSHDILARVTLKSIHQVLDPTLLFNKEFYISSASKIKTTKKYIACYIFDHNLSSKDRNNIIELSKMLRLPLISLEGWIEWCDDTFQAKYHNPFLHYQNAEYVITNTFHGTAFAINFNTSFISISGQNVKINELLSSLELGDRDCCGMSEDEMYKILHQPIDYSRINTLLDTKRKESIDYLRNNI